MVFTLPSLPYDYSALSPHIDELTMNLHHTKHHQARRRIGRCASGLLPVKNTCQILSGLMESERVRKTDRTSLSLSMDLCVGVNMLATADPHVPCS